MTDHPSIGGIPFVLGGNVFGFTADEDASFAILDKFYERGGRMVDTAQAYSAWVPGHVGGESETVIGKWLESRDVRSDMLVATKVGMLEEAGGLEPRNVADKLDRSLERLRTDYVDLYYAHRDDPQTPQDEVAAGFDAVVKSGKVREIGASNYDAARLGAIHDIATAAGQTPFTVLQNEYNLVSRDSYDPALQELCVDRGIAMLPWYGLASGFLTGKYRTRADLEGKTRGKRIGTFFDEGMQVLPTLDAVAGETGASQAAVALAWLLTQPGIAAPIASAREPGQLDAQFEFLDLELSPDQVERLTATRA